MIKRFQKNRLPSVLPNINSKLLGLYFQSEHTPNYKSRITIEKNKKDHLGLPKVKVEIKFNEIDKRSIVKAHDLFIKRFISTKAGNLQEKYSKKDIYGRGLEIHSLNFNKLKTWVEYNDNGKVFCVHI